MDGARYESYNGFVPLDYPGQVTADWRELLGIVEKPVKPERLKQSTNSKSSHDLTTAGT